jgi:hypothetical protein
MKLLAPITRAGLALALALALFLFTLALLFNQLA